jgi:hypothetical protein
MLCYVRIGLESIRIERNRSESIDRIGFFLFITDRVGLKILTFVSLRKPVMLKCPVVLFSKSSHPTQNGLNTKSVSD